MANTTEIEVKEPDKIEISGLRKLNFTELASMLHGLLFAYEKVFMNMYGNDVRELYPYLIDELAHVLHEGENPVIDTNKSLEENIERIIHFISNEEYLMDIGWEKTDDDKYIFKIGACTFAKSGVHDILKLKEGICPFGIIIAACITELNTDRYVRITDCEFDEEGSKTYMESIEGDLSGEGELQGDISSTEDLIFQDAHFKSPLDEMDLRILKELRRNARISNVNIAKILGTTESTVRRRFDSLLERGIIKGFTALLNYPPDDRFLRAFLGIKVKPTHIDAISSILSKMKETCSVYKTLGKYNLICEAIFNDRSKFQEFFDKLQYMEGIVEVHYSIGSSAPKPCPWYGF
jgi:DNA-binding Lrp family transcriptional regulator